MIEIGQVENLEQIIQGKTNIESLREAVAHLGRVEADSSDGEKINTLRLEAFDRLARLSLDALDETRTILLEDLLPLCLRETAEWSDKNAARAYSELLREWLERLPADHRTIIRQAVVQRLLNELEGTRKERACRLFAVVGYRDPRVVARLMDLAQTQTEKIADIAVRSLTSLGIPSTERNRLVQLWRDRASQTRWNIELIAAAQKLADVAILDFVFDNWLTRANLTNEKDLAAALPHLAVTIPALIAAKQPDNADLQDSIWNRLSALKEASSKLYSLRVFGSTDVAHRCDSPLIVTEYLTALQTAEDRVRLVIFSRLKELERPRQLSGWDLPVAEAIIQYLTQLAIAPSGLKGSFMTMELRRKMDAWEMLFSLGRRDVVDRLEDAIQSETNGNAVGEILNLAACFQIEHLPLVVGDLIAGKLEKFGSGEAERLSAHLGAIEVARSCRSRKGFESLLAFELIRPGGVLVNLMEALVDSATAQIRRGDQSVVEDLWAATGVGQPAHRRDAAAAALGRLVRHQVLSDLPEDRLLVLLENPELEKYPRRELLEAIGHFPKGTLSTRVLAFLQDCLKEPTEGNGLTTKVSEYRTVALRTLARQGLLTNNPTWLERHLDLQPEGNTWRLKLRYRSGIAGVIGLLYQDQPATFAPAITDLLSRGDWATVVQLIPFLEIGPRPLDAQIAAVIVQRIRRASLEFGEPDLLLLLGKLAPERLAAESWDESQQWPPQVRAALGNAFELIPRDLLSRKPPEVLDRLAGDGQYGVRRIAYRALSKLYPHYFMGLFGSWAWQIERGNTSSAERPAPVDLRQRAAEAAAWVPFAVMASTFVPLEWDVEPEVRETYVRCQREAQEWMWSNQYTQDVMRIKDDSSLLKAWRYGRALERIGDDLALEQLDQHERQTNLPPNIRFWLRRLVKKIRSRWEGVTRERGEPWAARRGHLEEIECVFVGVGSEEKQVRCWLWKMPASDDMEFGTWGGWCEGIVLQLAKYALMGFNRKRATVIITQAIIPKGPTYFKGIGAYPELVIAEKHVIDGPEDRP